MKCFNVICHRELINKGNLYGTLDSSIIFPICTTVKYWTTVLFCCYGCVTGVHLLIKWYRRLLTDIVYRRRFDSLSATSTSHCSCIRASFISTWKWKCYVMSIPSVTYATASDELHVSSCHRIHVMVIVLTCGGLLLNCDAMRNSKSTFQNKIL